MTAILLAGLLGCDKHVDGEATDVAFVECQTSLGPAIPGHTDLVLVTQNVATRFTVTLSSNGTLEQRRWDHRGLPVFLRTERAVSAGDVRGLLEGLSGTRSGTPACEEGASTAAYRVMWVDGDGWWERDWIPTVPDNSGHTPDVPYAPPFFWDPPTSGAQPIEPDVIDLLVTVFSSRPGMEPRECVPWPGSIPREELGSSHFRVRVSRDLAAPITQAGCTSLDGSLWLVTPIPVFSFETELSALIPFFTARW